MKQLTNVSLKNYTTLHIGGNARHLYLPTNQSEVIEALAYQPIVLGKGSNVLFRDEVEYEHVMVLNHFKQITIQQDTLICEAGATLREICIFAQQHALTGLEWAYGIPGSVGGAVYMNAGAYGGEISDVLQQVTVINEKISVMSKQDCQFSYRHSIFNQMPVCILTVTLKLKKGNPQLIQMKMDELLKQRTLKQPLDKYSAGSTFKRGKDYYASALIQEAKLQGVCVNEACVSTKHAGFLINQGKATSDDFLQLIEIVKQRVKETSGKELECEVKTL